MPMLSDHWTAERVRALPEDGNRYEAVDGVLLVTPAPSVVHQRIVRDVAAVLHAFVRINSLGELFTSPADVELDPHTLVQPDLFVVPPAERRIRRWSDIQTLLLAVEVASPGSARADRQIKRERYQRAGIAEYWVVDADAWLVERWRPGDDRPEIVSKRLIWTPGEHESPELVSPRLEIDLEPLFAEAWAE